MPYAAGALPSAGRASCSVWRPESAHRSAYVPRCRRLKSASIAGERVACDNTASGQRASVCQTGVLVAARYTKATGARPWPQVQDRTWATSCEVRQAEARGRRAAHEFPSSAAVQQKPQQSNEVGMIGRKVRLDGHSPHEGRRKPKVVRSGCHVRALPLVDCCTSVAQRRRRAIGPWADARDGAFVGMPNLCYDTSL